MSTEIERLEAVAAVVSHAGRVRWLRPELCEVGDQLCRLTEAQSIIAQRDALMSALESVVHDERVPNAVSQECAAVLIEALRLNPCRAQAVPDGYVMVPVNSTEAMRDAIDLLCDDSSAFDDSEAFWRYLLAAAPSAQQKESE